MRIRILALAVLLAVPLAGCDNFSNRQFVAPDVITVEGVWSGTMATTACTPAAAPSVDACAVLTAGDLAFQLFLSQQDDQLFGTLVYGDFVATIGGVVTEDDVIRLAGMGVATLGGIQYELIVRNWSTGILGRGIAGSRMTGTWTTEITEQGTEDTAVASHTIVSATRTQ